MGKTKGFTGVIEWDSQSQDVMIDPSNPYNHLNKKPKQSTVSTKDGQHVVLMNGVKNHSPQIDLELGIKSATHKAIAEKMAKLVCGKGLVVDQDEGSEEEQNELSEWISEKGLGKAVKQVINGIIYHGYSSVIATQDRPVFSEEDERIQVDPKHFTAQPSKRLRWSEPKMDEDTNEYIPFHYYHNDWLYSVDCNKRRRKPRIPKILPIQQYIRLSSSGARPEEAFFVCTPDHPNPRTKRYLSFPIKGDNGIFDAAYPLAKWKSNTSINAIQSEFESSTITTDYMRNGMHILAIINVYSVRYNQTTDNDSGTPEEDWEDSIEVIKTIKRSYNSGRIIVNALGTDDPKMDGKIEIEKIDLEFPAETYETLIDRTVSTILTAWGVNAQLFGITKKEGNSLNGREGQMKIGILLLKDDISMYQNVVLEGLNDIARYYGYDARFKIEESDSSVYLSLMADLAKEYMTKNEFRTKVLNLKKLEEDELERLMEELKITNSSRSSNSSTTENE